MNKIKTFVNTNINEIEKEINDWFELNPNIEIISHQNNISKSKMFICLIYKQL